jgi:hypothetical protein
MSEACSAGSAGSTTDLVGLGFDTRSSVRAILGGEECLPPGSPECPSMTTYEMYDDYNQDITGAIAPSLRKGNDRAAMLLISSAEASPAKTSALPDDAPDSLAAPAPRFSLSSRASQMSLLGPEDGFWSRTSPVSSPPAPARDVASAGIFYDGIAADGERLQQACLLSEMTALCSMPKEWKLRPALWAAVRVLGAIRLDALAPHTAGRTLGWSSPYSGTSAFTTSPSELWTADTSECPNDGGVSSSLADVLQDDVPSRYFLSPRAAAGILRRAEKRGRELPSHLLSALRAVAATDSTPRKQQGTS